MPCYEQKSGISLKTLSTQLVKLSTSNCTLMELTITRLNHFLIKTLKNNEETSPTQKTLSRSFYKVLTSQSKEIRTHKAMLEMYKLNTNSLLIPTNLTSTNTIRSNPHKSNKEKMTSTYLNSTTKSVWAHNLLSKRTL